MSNCVAGAAGYKNKLKYVFLASSETYKSAIISTCKY